MQLEQQSGSSSRTELVRNPLAGARLFGMMVMVVFVGVLAVLFAQGYPLPTNVLKDIGSFVVRSPLVLGIMAYVGLMVFLGCCLFLIPREDDSEHQAEA
jgi:hypothetical protein